MGLGNQIERKGLHNLRRRRKAAGKRKFARQVRSKMKAVIASGKYKKEPRGRVLPSRVVDQ